MKLSIRKLLIVFKCTETTRPYNIENNPRYMIFARLNDLSGINNNERPLKWICCRHIGRLEIYQFLKFSSGDRKLIITAQHAIVMYRTNYWYFRSFLNLI